MAVVLLELQTDHDVEQVYGSTELTRVARVTELVGPPEGQLLEALRDPGVPQLGDLWPNESYFVIRRRAYPDGCNAARVVLTYGTSTRTSFNQPPPPINDGQDVKQVSSSVADVETTTDSGGSPMLIPPPTEFAGLPTYRSTARVPLPVGTINFERLESSPPTARMRSLVGKLNSSTEGPYPAGTLLFVRLDAQSDDGGRLWRTVYEFHYRASWEHVDRWRAPDNKVPSSADEVSFDVIEQASFTTLDLDFSDSQTPI